MKERMKYNPDKHHRRSIRLQGYDYSQPGIYFITICTQNRERLFVVRVQNFEPLQNQNAYQHIIPTSIGSIIRGFKIGVTKGFRQNTDIYVVWQRNYYEHIIRNDVELYQIRQYIIDNPKKWKTDEN